MPLSRSTPSQKPNRERHECIPIHGEHGRFTVKSASAAKKGQDEAYIVDVLEENVHPQTGVVTIGTCPCRGYEIRKGCSHLEDAKAKHVELMAEAMGFTKYEL